MGYESRIYVVKSFDLDKNLHEAEDEARAKEDLIFGDVVSIFNLGKIQSNPNFNILLRNSKWSKFYIYQDNLEEPIYVDEYNHRLKQLNINALIQALEDDFTIFVENNGEKQCYGWDLKAFLEYLKVIKNNWFIYILHYGY